MTSSNAVSTFAGIPPTIRNYRGSQVGAPLIIAAATIAVLMVGLMTPHAMVGDEVTHFYIMTEQSKSLSFPNFSARIPSGWGEEEIRRYPHPFLWHYGGAVLYRLTNGSFFAVQVYQTFFWCQLLIVA